MIVALWIGFRCRHSSFPADRPAGGGQHHLTLRYPPAHRLPPAAAFTLLGIDLAQLTALLFITGGLANPFAPLVSVPVIISSASQPKWYSVALALLAVVGVTALAFSPLRCPGMAARCWPSRRPSCSASGRRSSPTTAFAAFYTYRVSLEASELAEALAATELVLQREQHLSQLDGLAAAAAHELGTPLATISVVAKEMERDSAPIRALARMCSCCAARPSAAATSCGG